MAMDCDSQAMRDSFPHLPVEETLQPALEMKELGMCSWQEK